VAANRQDWTASRQTKLDLIREYSGADILDGVRLEVEILTIPPGATILIDGDELAQKTPAVVEIDPFKTTQVVLEKKSFKPTKRRLGPFGGETEASQYTYQWPLLKTTAWTKILAGQPDIEADPAVWAGRVAFVDRNGRWLVRDANAGNLIKQGQIKGVDGVTAGIVTDGAVFFIATLDRRVVAFDAVTCSYLYTIKEPKAGVYATPVIANGHLYVVDEAGHAFAFDIGARVVRWRESLPHGVRAAPVVQGDHLVVLSSNGSVTVLHRARGKVVTRYQLQGYFSCAPAVAGEDDLIFATDEGRLYAVSRVSGNVAWETDLSIPIKRTPPVKGRSLFVSPKAGELWAVDTSTGGINHRYSGSNASARTPVQDAERIFFVNGRTLSAFGNSNDGYALAWTFQARGNILAGPVVRNGAVYIGDAEGSLYRVEAND
jgi:outer membrane protein assembly factor BamB